MGRTYQERPPEAPTRHGLIIREIRKENGLTQREFADIIGCTQCTVSNWENYRTKRIPKYYWSQFKEFFGVDLEWKVGGSDGC